MIGTVRATFGGRAWAYAMVLACAVAVVTHVLSPVGLLGVTTYLLLVGGAGLFALVGALRAPPRQRTVHLLLAAWLLSSGLGDLIWTVYTWLGRKPEVSPADSLISRRTLVSEPRCSLSLPTFAAVAAST
jgi:hypothetical protein